jgi:methyl-accepting chemotaxis protein
LIDQIAAAAKEQVEGVEQVNRAVAEMDKVTQQTAANAEESAAAAEEMNAQAQQMKGYVEELAEVIGGASAEAQPVVDRRPALPVAAASRKGPAARKAPKKVDPGEASKLIPFDEDGKAEFKDF